jgi:predicted nucleic acid-binding protein
MIILDTNVVSEPLKPASDPAVIDWLDRQAAETLYLTAISLSELLIGVEILPNGRRKQFLSSGLRGVLERLFGPRILPFDHEAAIAHALMFGRMRAAGRAISLADGQIAAIALQHGFSVATRDGNPFIDAGVLVIDPWHG